MKWICKAYIVSVEEGGANFYYVDDPLSGNGTLMYVGNAGEIEYWSHQIVPEDGFVSETVRITHTEDGIVMCEGTRWVLLDDANRRRKRRASKGLLCWLSTRGNGT